MASDLEVAAEVLSGEVISPSGAPPIPVRGQAPAHTLGEFQDLVRQVGLGAVAVAAVEAWLGNARRNTPATRRGYIMDASWWLFWLAARGLDPATVAPMETDRYAAAMQDAGLSPATRSRRLSAARSFYRYLVRHEVVARNPFEGMDMPKVSKVSRTRVPATAELDRMLAWAKKDALDRRRKWEEGRGAYSWAVTAARTYAVLCLLAVTAARVGGVCRVLFGGITWHQGQRAIELPVKGPDGSRMMFPLEPYVWEALEGYLVFRGADDGPLFQTDSGQPLEQQYIFKTIQRIARLAGLPNWNKIGVHSIRHAVAIQALRESKNDLLKVQKLLGHADPRTTLRYLRDVGALSESLTYDLGRRFAIAEAELLAPYEEGEEDDALFVTA
jgi:site-specific recombinase XerD